MNKTITEIILIILICLWFITVIIIGTCDIWNKPKKYYRIEYIYDNRGECRTTIKARTPKQAIRKLLRKHPRHYPLNDITDIKSCTEVDFYKCLKEA